MTLQASDQTSGHLHPLFSQILKWFPSFLILFLAAGASAQWTTQSPSPTHLEIRGIASPSADRVFIATQDDPFDDGGALFESNDGGITWTQRDIPEGLGDPLNGIFFLDSQNGWAFGNMNYRTTDGGTNWTPLPFLGSTNFMKFYTPDFGVATGNFGQNISRDGGESWEASPNGMFSYDFAGENLVLGASSEGIFRSIDGGISFTGVFPGEAKAVQFLTASQAIAIVDGSFIRSADGGETWTTIASANGKSKLSILSENTALAWGRSGAFPDFDESLWHTNDGGLSWTNLGEVIPAGVYAITRVGVASVVAADLLGNMHFSADGGMTWVESFSSPGQQPGFFSSASPVFANGQTGYFGYGSGFVIKSTDGGVSWQQISSGTGEYLTDIGRFPDGNMIAVGENGTLLKSNGDSPWISGNFPTTLDLVAVHIISSSEAVIADEEGRVYLTDNGGLTWEGSASLPDNLIQAADVHFTSLQEGWVIGRSFNTGALYHTTDGGDSWTPIPDFLGYYVAVDAEGDNVWALNIGGRYYRSVDGGDNWIEEELPGFPLDVLDMEFFDENIGYAVGSGGYALRTSDGGITWEELPTLTQDLYFTDIYLLDANELWLTTRNNVAYYSANGGQSWALLEIGSEGFGNFNGIVANPEGDAWTAGAQGYIEYFAGPPPGAQNHPPIASFDFLTTGLSVEFTDESSDPDGILVGWSWDFGDGNTSIEQNPSHTYETANTYLVYLTVTDDDGDTGTAMKAVVVQPGPGGVFGDFTEVTPLDPLFVTPQEEDFWVIATAPADFDNDGDLDIAVLGYYVVYNQSVEDRLVLLRNDGEATNEEWEFTYVDVELGDISTGASDMAWGDLDNDGDLDLVVGSNGVTLLYENNEGTLVLTGTELPGYWEDNFQAEFDLRSISWADYDNDGDLDLLIPSAYDPGTFSYRTALMRNDGPDGNGNWNFTEIEAGFDPTYHAQSLWADYDGDQDLDLLLINIAPLTDEGFIKLYTNNGDGTFSGEEILGSLAIEHGEAQWGDYDNDGDLDILLAGSLLEIDGTYTGMALRIYVNEGDQHSPLEVIDCYGCQGWFDITAATWADYNSDGQMDILLAGTYNSGSQIEGRAIIYQNENGAFTESENELPAPRASGSRGGTFSWLDLDSDGDLDYFIAGQYFVPGGNGLVEAQMHVYRNDGEGENNPPTAPANTASTPVGDDKVLLSWDSSTDDLTSSLALTYDLELFHNSTPVNLPTRLPEPGNISAVTEWLFSGLEEGQYEWGLRAVDAAYNGSLLVTGTFFIGTQTSVDQLETSESYLLTQNFPNPFRSFTTITYQIKDSGPVLLTVYDLFGQKVVVLVDETQNEGSYTVRLSGNEMPGPGIYFYSLQSGSNIETRKMIVSE